MKISFDGVKRVAFTGLAALFSLGASVAPGTARPLTPAETRDQPYEANVPRCEDPDVISRIQSQFHQAETEYWHSGLEIQAFSRVDQIGYRSNGADYIPRRYCVAEAVMNDQKLRSVSYAVGQDLGIIGWWGFGVEFCVAGLDREKAFSPNCKMARP